MFNSIEPVNLNGTEPHLGRAKNFDLELLSHIQSVTSNRDHRDIRFSARSFFNHFPFNSAALHENEISKHIALLRRAKNVNNFLSINIWRLCGQRQRRTSTL